MVASELAVTETAPVVAVADVGRSRTRGYVQGAVILLVGSGLMIRTFVALRRVQPGFTSPETIQTVRTNIPESLVRNHEQVIRIQNEVCNRILAIPGVTSVAFASEMPMDGIDGFWDGIRVAGDLALVVWPAPRAA